jgi:hypothetical protein
VGSQMLKDENYISNINTNMKKSKFGQDWWQLEIEDPNNLSGKSFSHILFLMIQNNFPQFVAIDKIVGGGKKIPQLISAEKNQEIISVNWLIEQCDGVDQFDWGDFYFFWDSKFNEGLKFSSIPSYLEKVANAPLTIRTVDSSYYFIYTKIFNFVNLFEWLFPQCGKKNCELDDLTFPE